MEKKIDNIVHHQLGHILTNKRGFRDGIYDLKNLGILPVSIKTSDKLIKVSKFYYVHVHGNPFPDSLDNIGVSKNNYYANNTQIEVNWFFVSLRKYRAEIQIFLNYKKDFEQYFLYGEYSKAEETVEYCINNLGYSIWAIYSKFLLYEYTGAPEKAKLLLSEILEKNKTGVFTSSLLSWHSQRTERKLSAYKYDNDLKHTLNKSKIDKSNIDYYCFQLNYFETPNFKEFKEILGYDYSNSIIDRYLTYRKLMFHSVCNETDLLITLANISYSSRKVNDDLFNCISLKYGLDLEAANFYDTSYIKILDLYYSGLYGEVCKEIRTITSKQGELNFTFLNLYAISLAYQNLPFAPLTDNVCLANELAQYIYNTYKKDLFPPAIAYNIYQISKNIDGFDINYQLNAFIKKEQNLKFNKNQYLLSFLKADPEVTESSMIASEAKEVLTKIADKTYINSISLGYRSNILDGNYEFESSISDIRRRIDKAKFLLEKGFYDLALEEWKNIYDSHRHSPPIHETAVDYIYRIYSKTNDIDKCIRWYVDSFISNPFIVHKINTSELHAKLRKGRFKNVTVNIHLPIFISLISTDENEKSFAVELFCKSFGVKCPTELIETSIPKDAYLEIFFDLSCDNETLNHYRHINTTKKRLEERIGICNYLAHNFSESGEKYTQELNLLTNELIIYEGTQKLDDSKIYANEQAILNRELDEYEGIYHR